MGEITGISQHVMADIDVFVDKEFSKTIIVLRKVTTFAKKFRTMNAAMVIRNLNYSALVFYRQPSDFDECGKQIRLSTQTSSSTSTISWIAKWPLFPIDR